MKTTVNLGLKKPEGTDVVNIDDFNYNADIIDTELQKRALKTDIPTIPVQSVNGKTGAVTLAAADVGAATSAQGIKADTALQSSQLGQAGGPAKQDDLVSHLADKMTHIPYAVATGSANTYAVTLSPAPTAYVDGMAVCVKINVSSTGASTLNVNGLGAKAILDSLGNAITSGGLKAGVPYTLRYNGTNFIVQGKGGGGDATADQVLSGKKVTVDSGPLTGTMANKASATISTIADSQLQYASITTDPSDPNYRVIFPIKNLPAGYYDGNTQINVSLWGVAPQFVKAGAKIGRWDSPLVGTYEAKRYATGTVNVDGNYNSDTGRVIVSGLSFTPSMVFIYRTANPSVIWKCYVRDYNTDKQVILEGTSFTYLSGWDNYVTYGGFKLFGSADYTGTFISNTWIAIE